MAEKTTTTKPSSLLPTYIVAVVTLMVAATCGAITIGMGIALFTNNSVTMPGLMGMILGSSDRLVTPVALGLVGALAGLAGFMALGRIKKSVEAGNLVTSNSFHAVNTAAVIVSGLIGSAFVIYALSVALTTLLAIQDGLPWGAYYLGQFVPSLLVGGSLLALSMMIKSFSKAKVSATALGIIFWTVALVGFVLVGVAVGIKSHDKGGSTLFGGSSYITTTVKPSTTTTTTEPVGPTKKKETESDSGSGVCSNYKITSDVVNAYLDKDLSYSEYLTCYSQLSGYSQ